MDLEIIKIASNTENNKILKNHTHFSKMKNSICGDEMHVSVKIVKDNIVDFGYQCKSCVYCQASVSLLSRKAINLPFATFIPLFREYPAPKLVLLNRMIILLYFFFSFFNKTKSFLFFGLS